ncbi:MAG: glycoside hydrolase family 18 protein [Cytophagaceae bacterium]|jgi:chitinase|nr:glycoside hydrolase family 18 protein [Cytophagaceae bacterium]
MKRLLALFFALIPLSLVISCSEQKDASASAEQNEMNIIAYYYGDSSGFKSYPTEQLTHIIYSFLFLQGNKMVFDKPQDSVAVAALVKLKEKNKSLKILLSIGGWGGCETCSQVFSKEKGRTEFVQSVKALLVRTKTDGIDLDWEYPAIEGFPGHRFVPEDKHNFTLLIQNLRKTLGDQYEISFAAGGYTEYLEKSIEWKEVMPLVDRVNLMSYDLTNGYSVVTGHHTPLYSTPQQKESTDHGVHFLDSVGVPLNKIVIGAAFYARIFNQVDSLNNGLNRPCKFKTGVDFKDFKDSLKGFAYHWDSIARAPYAYNTVKKEFATFDNEQSIAAKVTYIKEKKLNGIMFWQLSGDKTQAGLLETIYKVNKPLTVNPKDLKQP